MYVPRYWAKSREAAGGANNSLLLQTWGWSDFSRNDALEHAERRLIALLQRVSNARDLRHAGWYYSSGERPLREEIIDTSPAGADPTQAVVTRNRYGVLVLNTARLMFLDIDLPTPPPHRRLLSWWFSRRPDPEPFEGRLARLRTVLAASAIATFRLYRTAAGLRAVAIDREFDPDSEEAYALMQEVEADEMFIRLCRGQKSFRARLTPKPWRCGAPIRREIIREATWKLLPSGCGWKPITPARWPSPPVSIWKPWASEKRWQRSGPWSSITTINRAQRSSCP